eukprot:m.174937 g.174937  ORF g.174937 m.174937 type:complete len:334 (-) comp15414_c0_seq7:1939-2940(-)
MIKPLLFLSLLLTYTHNVHTTGCGIFGVKLLKLHKVGSSTLAAVVEAYASRHSLSICPRTVPKWPAPPLPLNTSPKKECKIITSHERSETVALHWGLSAFLETLCPRACKSVILIRNPRDRLLSRYYFDLLKGKHHLSVQEGPRGGNWLSLEEMKQLDSWLKYISGQDKHADNNHYLKALGINVSDFNKNTDATNRLVARSMLTKFDVVGITERMPQTVVALAHTLGCSQNMTEWVYPSLKSVPGRPTEEALPLYIRGAIDAIVRHDMIVWEEARKLAIERENALGVDFVSNVRILQKELQVHGHTGGKLTHCNKTTSSRKLHGFICIAMPSN